MSAREVADMLRRSRFFSRLSEADVSALAAAFQTFDHRDGHAFLRQGDRGDGAWLVLSGVVAVSRTRDGAHAEVNRLQAGDFFGIIALLDDRPRAATCVAEGLVRAAFLPRDTFEHLFESDVPAAHALQDAVAAQLCEDMRRLQADVRALHA